MKIAVYPGSFDPITNGHLDIVERAVKLFDRVILAVARREAKRPLFSADERAALAREVTSGLPNVEVARFDNLLVDFVRERSAGTVIRGLRAVLDFDYEFQMVLTNRKIAPDVDTVFFLPSERYFYLSSSMVKEIASLGGPVSCFVAKPVLEALRTKFPNCR